MSSLIGWMADETNFRIILFLASQTVTVGSLAAVAPWFASSRVLVGAPYAIRFRARARISVAADHGAPDRVGDGHKTIGIVRVSRWRAAVCGVLDDRKTSGCRNFRRLHGCLLNGPPVGGLNQRE